MTPDLLAGMTPAQNESPRVATQGAARSGVVDLSRYPLNGHAQDFFADVETMKRWKRVLHRDSAAVELRALDCVESSFRRPHTRAGIFDPNHFDEMCKHALKLSRDNSPSVYFTLNEVHPDLLARFNNRQDITQETVKDSDIKRRLWLPLDLDPIRRARISATDSEKALAWELAEKIKSDLAAAGWPEPIVADSGNGIHLLFRIDLPADDGGIIERCLKSLAKKYDTDAVTVDKSVYNASRIMKFYGTMARKGDDTPERPWRRSKIISIPEGVNERPVPLELLESLAAESPATPKNARARAASLPPAAFGPASKKLLKAVRRYMAAVPGAESGNGGHNATLKAANVLVVKFALTTDEAMPIFLDWNQTCSPPWDERDLQRKLEEALKDPHGIHGELRKDKEKQAAKPSSKGGALIEAGAAQFGGEIAIEKPKACELDPMITAREFASENLTHSTNEGKHLTLRRWQGEWHWWNPAKRRYVRVSEDMVRAQLRLYLEPTAEYVTNSVVSNIMGNLAAVLILSDSVEMPSWINDAASAAAPQFPAAEILATRSQLIHLPSLIDGQVRSQPATPRFFSSTSLDFEFDPNALPPVAWFEFLRQGWGDDYESIECLQEWFGYLLSPDTSLQKILVIVGPRRSGKGTIGRVLRGLVGNDNMAAPTLAGLGTNFGLWPIYDKSVAVVSDARLSGRTDSAVVTERLLSISGEDAQTFDRKNMKPMTMKLPTRFVIMTNELPRLGDSSNALVGRFIVLRMTKSFYGQEDAGLTEKLLAELPGILLWAVEGWKRLRARGRFVQPETGKSLIHDMEALASPVGEFVRDCCVLGPSEETPRDEMYSAWRRWCAKHGKQETEQATFGRDLRASVTSLGDKQRNTLGVRVRCYTGIGLRAECLPSGSF